MRLTIVTNIPAPYRTPIYELLARTEGVDLTLLYFAAREPDREWDLQAGSFRSVFLPPRFVTWRGRYIHFSPGVTQALHKLGPDAIVTDGFNPAHLIAFQFAQRHRVPHIPMTDGTLQSEQSLSVLHRRVRQYIFRRSSAFIGASNGSFDLYRSYGIDDERIFKSQLCSDIDMYKNSPEVEKRFDFIFCGRLAPGKSPGFSLEVAKRVSEILGRRVRLLIVGSGPLLSELKQTANAIKEAVETEFFGFATQTALPALYRSARVFLFPSKADVWGVVANEACAAGLPVLITPAAGAAGEIVIHDINGYVLPLDIEDWAVRASSLLSDSDKCLVMGQKSIELIQPYNYKNAADGLLAAARYATR